MKEVGIDNISGHYYYPGVKGFKGETIPALLLERCLRTPDKAAYKVKDRGIYKNITWREYKEHVENLCLGLVELGLKKGDRVAIMGDPFVELCWTELAPQCAGAISFGIYPTCPPHQVKYYMTDSGAKFFIGYNQEFMDRILPVADELPNLERIIVIDPRAMFMYSGPRIMTLEEVEAIGARVKEQKPTLFEEMVSSVKPDDICGLCYTSGTTGEPRGGVYTHSNWTGGWYNIVYQHALVCDEKATTVAFMPLAHIVGRMMAIYQPIVSGYTVCFGESADAMQETLVDIAPTILMGAPRTFEKLAAQVLVGIESSSWIKKVAYRIAMNIGRNYTRRKWEGRVSIPWSVLYRLAYWIVFRPILDKLGLRRVKLTWVGAAPVPPTIMALFQVWGLNTVELYGATEGGVICVQRGPFPMPGTSGPPLIGTELRIAANGEGLVRNHSFSGYWEKEEATAEIFKGDWVCTGDALQLKGEDNIKIYDRIKDVILTSGGKTISPVEIEKAVKASPYISDVIVFGDGRKYPVALVEIDFDTVSEWARGNGILYTSFTSLATHPKIYELIEKEVEKGSRDLARVEQVKKFRIIPKEFDPEEMTDPITPTRKVQRRKMYERFQELIESMYSRAEEERVLAELGDIVEEVK